MVVLPGVLARVGAFGRRRTIRASALPVAHRSRRLAGWRPSLHLLCEGTDELAVYDTRARAVLRRSSCRACPKGFALPPDAAAAVRGQLLERYELTTRKSIPILQTLRTLPAGFEPNAAVPDLVAGFLYVANRIGGDVSVVDLDRRPGGQAPGRRAGRQSTWRSLPTAPRLLHPHLPLARGSFARRPNRRSTVIDTGRQEVVERYAPPRCGRRLPCGAFGRRALGIAAQLRPKNLVPLAHVEHGWVIGNSLSRVREGRGRRGAGPPRRAGPLLTRRLSTSRSRPTRARRTFPPPAPTASP